MCYLCFCSVDAAYEDGSLGRLVNNDHLNPNAKMKYLTVEGKPHLCLFAIRDISPGEEITYNYADRLPMEMQGDQMFISWIYLYF